MDDSGREINETGDEPDENWMQKNQNYNLREGFDDKFWDDIN